MLQSKINIVQVYANTSHKNKEELEEFYSKLETTKSRDVTIIVGNMNTNSGKRSEEKFIRNFGLRLRNTRVERQT